MKSHQDPSSFVSLQQLIAALEDLTVLEFIRNDHPWISINKLKDLFYEKYQISLEEVAKNQGYYDGLKSLFIRSRRFSLYGTPKPQQFYVAPLQAVASSSYAQNETQPIQYKIKRYWRVDSYFLKKLKNEGAQEIKFQQSPKISKYQPTLIPEIKSVDDLSIVLMEIIKDLAINYPKQMVTVAILSKSFRSYYGQPIRTMLRNICPDVRLIDLLQTMPNLDVKQVDHDWQITLNLDSWE